MNQSITSHFQKTLLVIVGPTASGKSELAMKLAKKLDGEIIAADSLTVRKGLDIGSAKPTTKDQKTVPHHLLDVVEPCADFTAAVYKQMATEAIDQISARGKMPILVGGTGLYIDSVLYDYQFLPAGDRKAREKYNQMSLGELLKLIQERGIDAEGIDQRNKRRLIRLLETSGQRPIKSDIRPNTQVIGLRPNPDRLAKNIDQRVKKMIAGGLKQEVARLVDKYGWDCESLKGIGYQQWRKYFDGERSLGEVEKQIVSATKNLVKKQNTWFARNRHIKWFSSVDEAFKDTIK